MEADFAEQESFDISGRILDQEGNAVAGVLVELVNASFAGIENAKTTSDSDGYFEITDIPDRSPRHIVSAQKDGFFKCYVGRIGKDTSELNIVLDAYDESSSYRERSINVKAGYILREERLKAPTPIPQSAILDVDLYPDEVLPYLDEGEGYEITEMVESVAGDILEGIPESGREDSIAVARGVYEWVCENINYDLVKNYKGDITSGNFQTTYGGFGRDFDDWCYSPEEIITEGRAICIEFERLATALLRCLDIPARSTPLKAHPVTQFWVQEDKNGGFWANMETSVGSSMWREGNKTGGFPSKHDSNIAIIPVDENAPIHMDWDFGADCFWTEDYGGSMTLGNDIDDFDSWKKILEDFSKTGALPESDRNSHGPEKRRAAAYNIYTRGFTVDLCNATETNPVIRFPFFVEHEWREQLDMAVYVSIPGIIDKEWVEEDFNPETGLTQKWYCVELDLTRIKPLEYSEDILANGGFETNSSWEKLVVARDKNAVFHSFSSIESKTGDRSACIEIEKEGIGVWRQRVEVDSPSTVYLTGYIKTENVGAAAFIDLHPIIEGNPQRPPYPKCKPDVARTSDWTFVEGYFEVPEGATAVEIGCTLIGSGKAYFDDVSVKVVKE